MKHFWTTILAIVSLGGSAATADTVDFNTPGDFGSSSLTSTYFNFTGTSPWFSEAAGIGASGSRGLQLNASGNDVAMTYKLGAGLDFSGVGATFQSSILLYKSNAITNSTSRLFDLGAAASPTDSLLAGLHAGVRVRSTSTSGISLQFRNNNADVGTASSVSLTTGRFYRLSFSMTNLDAANIQMSASIDDYGASGASLVSSNLLTLGGSYLNPSMTSDPSIYTGIRARNENSSNAISRLDNLSFSGTTGAPPIVRTFSHPGLLNNAAEVAHYAQRANANDGLWSAGYQKVISGVDNTGASFVNHVPQPVAQYTAAVHWSQPGIARNLLDDGRAAYANVLAFQTNRNPAHAAKARQILSAWATTMTTVVNSANQPISAVDSRQDYMLYTSYSWPAMIWTAEALRGDPASGWTNADDVAFTSFVKNVVRPAAEHSNNNLSNNWASWRVAYKMSDAIYTNDTARFNQAIAEYRAQVDNYIGASLQGEMDRDLWHSQMGLAPLLLVAEMALKQGVDLYSHRNNRLLRAIEYQTPFFMGDYTNWPLVDAPDPLVQSDGSTIWNMYEMAYNHYHNRLGLNTPNIASMLGQSNVLVVPNPGAGRPYRAEDFFRTGYGTLTHAGDPVKFAVLQGFDMDQAATGFQATGNGTVAKVSDPLPGQSGNGVLKFTRTTGTLSASQQMTLDELFSLWFDWRFAEAGSVVLMLDGQVLDTINAPAVGAGLSAFDQYRQDFALADYGLLPGTYALDFQFVSGQTFWLDNVIVTTASIPEPITLPLLGAIGIALMRRRV